MSLNREKERQEGAIEAIDIDFEVDSHSKGMAASLTMTITGEMQSARNLRRRETIADKRPGSHKLVTSTAQRDA